MLLKFTKCTTQRNNNVSVDVGITVYNVYNTKYKNMKSGRWRCKIMLSLEFHSLQCNNTIKAGHWRYMLMVSIKVTKPTPQ